MPVVQGSISRATPLNFTTTFYFAEPVRQQTRGGLVLYLPLEGGVKFGDLDLYSRCFGRSTGRDVFNLRRDLARHAGGLDIATITVRYSTNLMKVKALSIFAHAEKKCRVQMVIACADIRVNVCAPKKRQYRLDLDGDGFYICIGLSRSGVLVTAFDQSTTAAAIVPTIRLRHWARCSI